jgi:hypothetical protein
MGEKCRTHLAEASSAWDVSHPSRLFEDFTQLWGRVVAQIIQSQRFDLAPNLRRRDNPCVSEINNIL